MATSDATFAWWQTGVIYQIYPRSFNDSNNDGVGDLQGIIDKLDYLNDGTSDSLGVDAIWISPIYPSPMADFGYDVADYCDIHPMFGDLATFDCLLEEAHRRNMKIILDFVANHSSDEHPWFQESRSSRDNPKRDWYIWRDAKPDGSPPNNWGNAFGGRAWTWDEHTEQYYLHLFHKKQPDFNWRNPEVQEALHNVLHFWLKRGVDGFRMDVVGFLTKDEELRDNPWTADSDQGHPDDIWGRQEHKYDIYQPGVHTHLRDFRTIHDSYGERITIGEIWVTPRTRWVEYYGQNMDELHLPFNFELLQLLSWSASAFRASVDELEAALPPGAWPNYVLGNHDQSRLGTKFGKESIRVAAMLLLTLRGTPTIYMGEEIGMVDGVIPEDKIQDPQGLNLGVERTRDVCRTPFQWTAEAHAGFSTVDPWLPVAEGFESVNVAAQLDDPTSVLTLYRRLLHLRKAMPALNRGSYSPVDVPHSDCYVYLRECDSKRFLVALNFGAADVQLDLQETADSGSIVITTGLDRDDDSVDLARLSLRPHEGLLIAL